jgi:hypothetical protein
MSTYANVSTDYNIVTAGNLNVVGNLITTGYIQAPYYLGDGQFLTNVTANIGSASILQNGTSNVSIPVSSGNINFSISGTQQMVASTTSLRISYGTPSISNTTGSLAINGGLGVTGNIYGDSLYANNIPVLNENSIVSGGTF